LVKISHCISVCRRFEGRDDFTGEIICNRDYEDENYYKKKNKNINNRTKASEVGFI